MKKSKFLQIGIIFIMISVIFSIPVFATSSFEMSDVVGYPEDIGVDDFTLELETSPTVGVIRPDVVEGDMENIIIIIALADQDPIIPQRFLDQIEYRFNTSTRSLARYMEAASGGLVTVNSTVIGSEDDLTIVYQDGYYTRGHLLPYDPDTNPNGYRTLTEGRTRRRELLERAVRSVENHPLLEDKTLDTQRLGFVDSVTFIVRGLADSRSVLWMHKGNLATPNSEGVYLNGIRVDDYSFLLEGNPASLSAMSTAVIIHEHLHIFSFLQFPGMFHLKLK